MDEPSLDLALHGMKVLHVGGGIAAAFCAHLLAGYGADAVRVDGLAQDWVLSEDEAVYLAAGRPRVVLTDAVTTEDHPPAVATTRSDTLDRLVSMADVIVSDAAVGRFDIARWRADNPSLVAVTITPFGHSGPDRHLPADDLVAFAAGGMMSLTGDPVSTPLVTGGSQAFWYGGLHAFSAVVAAFYGAVLHGEGDWIDLSLQEALAGSLELYGPASALGEPAAVRFGNYHRAVWALYPCADGHAGVFCLERQIPALFDLIGEGVTGDGVTGDGVTGEGVLHQERFRDPLQRPDHDEELSAYILSFMVDHTGDKLARIGAERKIPFGKVRTPAELLDSPALNERGFFDEVASRPDGRPWRVPGRPFLGVGWHGERDHESGAITVDALVQEWSNR